MKEVCCVQKWLTNVGNVEPDRCENKQKLSAPQTIGHKMNGRRSGAQTFKWLHRQSSNSVQNLIVCKRRTTAW
jgi:hypothetical protein